jgi:hypothetical protein
VAIDFEVFDRLREAVDATDRNLGGSASYGPNASRWTEEFVKVLAQKGLVLRLCAACEGDPEAHDMHVCGRDE